MAQTSRPIIPAPGALRARPHNIQTVPCPLPGYEGLRVNVCVSYTRAERVARAQRCDAQVEAEARTRAQAEYDAWQVAEVAAGEETDPESVARAEANLRRLIYEAAVQRHQQALNICSLAAYFVEGWDRWPFEGAVPDPANAVSFEEVGEDLVAWLTTDLKPAALKQLLPN